MILLILDHFTHIVYIVTITEINTTVYVYLSYWDN